MDLLTKLLEHYRPAGRHLFSGEICGRSAMRYAGNQAYLHVLQSGQLTVNPDTGDPFVVTEPSVIFFSTFHQHELEGDLENPAKMTCATVEFGNSASSPITKFMPPMIVFRLADFPSIKACAELLRLEAKQKALGWLGAVDGLFSYMTTLLIRQACENGDVDRVLLNSSIDRRIEKALVAIHDHPEAKWSLVRLARECAMSRASFARRFLEVTGSTPIDYLHSHRLTLAKEMLKRGESVKAAASRSGFSSLPVFSRSFTRTEGVSPSNWLSIRERERE